MAWQAWQARTGAGGWVWLVEAGRAWKGGVWSGPARQVRWGM